MMEHDLASAIDQIVQWRNEFARNGQFKKQNVLDIILLELAPAQSFICPYCRENAYGMLACSRGGCPMGLDL